MKTEGLAPRVGGRDWSIPVSRDYKLVIPCENTRCPINKSQYCSMPSVIVISSGGRCQTGIDLILEASKTKKSETGYYKHEGD